MESCAGYYDNSNRQLSLAVLGGRKKQQLRKSATVVHKYSQSFSETLHANLANFTTSPAMYVRCTATFKCKSLYFSLYFLYISMY